MNDENRSKDNEARAFEAESGFRKLYDIIATLRGENGCAWDRKQTSETLLPSLIEETFELVDAVDERDFFHIKEELGDLFLLVTMISYINEQENRFIMSDVFQEITEKLIRRHPHVFQENQELSDPDEIIDQWNKIKKHVEGRGNNGNIVDTIPLSIPPLERAYQIQKKVAKHGFDWQCTEDVMNKLHEEIGELENEIAESKNEGDHDSGRLEDELGDLLFSVVNVARHLNIDPSVALHRANRKFIDRFSYIEKKMHEANLEVSSENFEKMDDLWTESKSTYS